MNWAKNFVASFLICLSFSQLRAQGEWSTPVIVSDPGVFAILNATTSGTGIGIGIWSPAVPDQIDAAVFNGQSWMVPITISTGSSASPDVSLSPCSKIATAVWIDNDMGDLRIAAARFDGKNWSSPVLISAITSILGNPRVSTDGRGNAVAVWSRFNAMDQIIQTSRFTGDSWTDPFDLSSTGADAVTPRVGTDINGNAIAVWNRDGTIQARRFNGSIWETVVNLGTDGTVPEVSVNCKGRAVAAWPMGTSASFDIRVSVFDGTSWSLPAQNISGLEAVDVTVSPPAVQLRPSVSMDPCGNAMVTWIAEDGSMNNRLKASRFNQVSWSNPAITLSPAGFNVFTHTVGTDYFQNALVFWTTDTLVQASRFSAGAFSQPPFLIGASLGIDNSIMSVFPSGKAIGLWLSEGVVDQTVQASDFRIETPGFAVNGCRIENRFLTQKETIKCITWEPSTACCVTSYRIFRNGKFVCEIPSDCPLCFQDRMRTDCCDGYRITAVSCGCVPVESVCIFL